MHESDLSRADGVLLLLGEVQLRTLTSDGEEERDEAWSQRRRRKKERPTQKREGDSVCTCFRQQLHLRASAARRYNGVMSLESNFSDDRVHFM